MANIHYWLTPDENLKLKSKLDKKASSVIIIGRYKTLNRHKSPCHLEYLRGLFNDWQEVKVIHDKKHFSVMFKNPNVNEVDVDNIFHYQQFFKSKKFLPSYNKLIDRVLDGGDFDPLNTDYFEYLKWRKFKNKQVLLKRHIDLVNDMKLGLREPLTIGRMVNGKMEPNRLVDGDHRLIVAKKLGINKIICKKS